MPLDDAAFNGFSTSLASRFARRAKGLDDASRRLVVVRPADHVLAGFLTPQDRPRGSNRVDPIGVQPESSEPRAELDQQLAEDLPRDSSYEQTSIGLEWIAPQAEIQPGTMVDLRAEVCVFVRRLPTLEEQQRHATWQSALRGGDARAARQAAPSPDDQCTLIPIWTREDLRPLELTIDLSELNSRSIMTHDLSADVAAAVHTISTQFLFPGRRAITLTRANLASSESYAQRLGQHGVSQVSPIWQPLVDIRSTPIPTRPGFVRIALRVINRSPRPSAQTLEFVDPNLYGLRLALHLPRRLHVPTEFQELRSSFRYDREMSAVGINAHVEQVNRDDSIILVAETVPHKRINRLEPREVTDGAPLFTDLADEPGSLLRRILSAMREYDEIQWSQKIASLQGIERDDALTARQQFQTEIARFERGIQLLENSRYPHVRRAFSLMNQAMRMAARGYDRWRLFQIVFIVSQLPGLAAREHTELFADGDNSVDILWFAAGGGKTEAFLGLILWQAFFDRLRGKRFGTAALVRFPLRLLAFQQLQRLGRALAMAEVLRSREADLGGARFSMGYFVGQSVTPNSIDNETHARFLARGVDPRYQRIPDCPFCSSPVTLSYAGEVRLIEHRCTNGQCSGGRDRLPLYIVDDDLYRYLPTVVISTVDKLAQIGQNHRVANIFGRVDLLCGRHGASFSNANRRLCPAADAFETENRLSRCEGEAVHYAPFHDLGPALLIQDELHLLSEELGTFDAHYETGVMQYARAIGGRPWKIIAATATIEDYEQHAWQLYLLSARQFPGPGPEAYESFYYEQNRDRIGRLFVGVLGVGRKHTPAVTRTLTLLYAELEEARTLAEQDPAGASALYGTGLLSREEFRELIFNYELPLTYVLTRKGSDQVAESIESRVKKELRDLYPEHQELLIKMFNGGVDVFEMMEAMNQIKAATPDEDATDRIRGLVTTNIISHGVDVDRFNIMVFAGFTRLVAEYIQASARVGRTFPGISIFVATPQSERDRSIFDRFGKFHEYLDRLVDPSAVTRWPEPALERTVPGLLAAYLMGVASLAVGRPLSTVEAVLRVYGSRGAEALNDDAIVGWMREAYGVAHAPSERYAERMSMYVRNKYSTIVNSPGNTGGVHSLNTYLGAMRSLRDVDDPAYIRVVDQHNQAILRRLTSDGTTRE